MASHPKPWPYINVRLCLHCGSCQRLCPQVFHQDDAGHTWLSKEAAATPQAIQNAMDHCPMQCIAWHCPWP